MVILVTIVVVLLIIGVVVVVRSGAREIQMDEKDQMLGDFTPPSQYHILPRLTMKPEKEEESWTLDSVEDTAVDTETESE